MSLTNSSLINKLIDKAQESELNQQLASCLLKNRKQFGNIYTNNAEYYDHGKYRTSTHSEVNTLFKYFGSSLKYSDKKGWTISPKFIPDKKLDIIVIRLGKKTTLLNSRPCHFCLEMMKDCNINKVHYSYNNIIYTEKVNNMISISCSNLFKKLEREHNMLPKNGNDFFKYLLMKYPKCIPEHNLNCFLKFNFYETLEDSYYKIINSKIKIYTQNNKLLIIFNII